MPEPIKLFDLVCEIPPEKRGYIRDLIKSKVAQRILITSSSRTTKEYNIRELDIFFKTGEPLFVYYNNIGFGNHGNGVRYWKNVECKHISYDELIALIDPRPVDYTAPEYTNKLNLKMTLKVLLDK